MNDPRRKNMFPISRRVQRAREKKGGRGRVGRGETKKEGGRK